LLAASLVHSEMEAEAEDCAAGLLAASGFRDTTRLAAGEVPMMRDILLTNRDAVEAALDTLERQLGEVRGMLGEPSRLEAWMVEAQRKRREMFT
jgi:prephenate dehydrogenase